MKYLLSILLTLFVQTTFAQTEPDYTIQKVSSKKIHKGVKKFTEVGNFKLAKYHEKLTLRVPVGSKKYVLKLKREHIKAKSITTGKGNLTDSSKSIFYTGKIRGKKSTVALTITPDGVPHGYFSDSTGQHEIGDGITFENKDITDRPDFECQTLAAPEGQESLQSQLTAMIEQKVAELPAGTKCINLYLETDYDIFKEKGSTQAVTDFAMDIFFKSKVLWETKAGVKINLQTLYINTATDAYTGTTTSENLSQFINRVASGGLVNSGKGDLFCLFGYTGSGGMAGVDGLCNIWSSSKCAYCRVYSTTGGTSTYSWNVEVYTHETGHTIGLVHTHDCSWTIGGVERQRIDGCGGCAGTCPCKGLPAGGGGIMSYCHTASVGINFNIAFEPPVLDFLQLIFQYNMGCLTENCAGTQPPVTVNNPPVVVISSGKANDSTYTLSANVTDENLSTISYGWNGSFLTSVGTPGNVVKFPYTASNGTYQYYCIVNDDHQLKDTSNILTINYTKPVVPPPTTGACESPFTGTEMLNTGAYIKIEATRLNAQRAIFTNCKYCFCINGVEKPITTNQIYSRSLLKSGDKVTCFFQGSNFTGWARYSIVVP